MELIVVVMQVSIDLIHTFECTSYHQLTLNLGLTTWQVLLVVMLPLVKEAGKFVQTDEI